MYKAGFTLSLNGGRVSRTALVEKTELNAEYDKLLEAALAELGDMYFSLMSPHLGSRYDDMCREWSAQGAGAYLGGAPAVSLAWGPRPPSMLTIAMRPYPCTPSRVRAPCLHAWMPTTPPRPTAALQLSPRSC